MPDCVVVRDAIAFGDVHKNCTVEGAELVLVKVFGVKESNTTVGYISRFLRF